MSGAVADSAAKGQDLLIQMLARPEWRERRVEVNLYGTGSHELTLRRMTEMLQVQNVHLRGHVSDVKRNLEREPHIGSSVTL